MEDLCTGDLESKLIFGGDHVLEKMKVSVQLVEI